MKRNKQRLMPLLAATLCTGTALSAGDGSKEKGFVPPPADRKLPPAPPRTISSAVSFIGCCCFPVTPMSRPEPMKPT